MYTPKSLVNISHIMWYVGGGEGRGLGVRILCSKIRELCYALMLTIYAPRISHYAPEICHYASKQNNFLGHKITFSHRTVTKHIERLQNSRIEAKCHWLVMLVALQHQRCLNVILECTILVLQPSSLHSAIFFLASHMKLHMRNMYGAKKWPNYASIMLDALKGHLYSKLCRHNIHTPSAYITSNNWMHSV